MLGVPPKSRFVLGFVAAQPDNAAFSGSGFRCYLLPEKGKRIFALSLTLCGCGRASQYLK